MVDPLDAGRRLYEAGRKDLAEREFRRALAADPELAVAHAYLALCLVRGEGRKGEARKEAAEAMRLGPGTAFVHYVHGLIALMTGDQAAGERSAREAIRLDPENAYWFFLLSDALYRRSAWREALEAADRGLGVDPTNVLCLNMRSIALRQLHRLREAAESIGIALEQDPESALTHANRGFSCLAVGDLEAAEIDLREALRINPESDLAHQGLRELRQRRSLLHRDVADILPWRFWLRGGRPPGIPPRDPLPRPQASVGGMTGWVVATNLVSASWFAFLLVREVIARPDTIVEIGIRAFFWLAYTLLLLTGGSFRHFAMEAYSGMIAFRVEDRPRRRVATVLVHGLFIGLSFVFASRSIPGLILWVLVGLMARRLVRLFLRRIGPVRGVAVPTWKALVVVIPPLLAVVSAGAVLTPEIEAEILHACAGEPVYGILLSSSFLFSWIPALKLVDRLVPNDS